MNRFTWMRGCVFCSLSDTLKRPENTDGEVLYYMNIHLFTSEYNNLTQFTI